MNKFLTGGVVVALVLSGLAFFGAEDGSNGRDGRDGETGAMVGPEVYDAMTFFSTVNLKWDTATSSTGTTTLTSRDSGQIVSIGGTGGTTTLPAVTNKGAVYTVRVEDAFATNNHSIVSAEEDNIDGSLWVADALVACASEDIITFVVDGEAIGDFVTLISDGYTWNILNSRGETASKLVCSS